MVYYYIHLLLKFTVLNVVIIKTKVHFRQGYIDNHSRFWISWLCPLVFLFPKTFKLVYVAFQFFFNLSIPDEGYFRNVSCSLN